MIKLIVAEDDPKLNEIIVSTLKGAGYSVEACLDGKSTLDKLENNKFDLVVSDIMMPGLDGFELAKNIRMFDKNIPILFITARDDMAAKQKGYNIGIDDYLVKPFEVDELILRIGALLRRVNITSSKKLVLGDFVMDEEERSAKYCGDEIALSVKEFDILFKLLSFPKKPFTRSQLMDEFWDYDSSATSRTVDVYMAKLREKTAKIKEFSIVTVHGLGYKAVINE